MVLTRYKQRRQELYNRIEKNYGDGIVVLVSGFERDQDPYRFRQESNFYYFTGIKEPGVILCYVDGLEVLYVPDYPVMRKKWVVGGISLQEDPRCYGFDEIRALGVAEKNYSLGVQVVLERYQFVVQDLVAASDASGRLYSLFDHRRYADVMYAHLWNMFQQWYPQLTPRMFDCSRIVYDMRRTKDLYELDCLQKAVDITIRAQQEAARVISDGVYEYEIQAAIEKVFIESGALGPAFSSIVAAGKHTTVLHYNENNNVVRAGDLVVVDIGASYDGYAADITRTYAVNREFTKRQAEIYDLVLEAQEYIASIACPGMYLKYELDPEQSLHHRAVQFFQDRGMGDYFPHGIGHYLGLDVHDVGDYTTPLRIGDVFTIEPGLYIPGEWCGVRIEDDYCMKESGACALSQALPKARDVASLEEPSGL